MDVMEKRKKFKEHNTRKEFKKEQTRGIFFNFRDGDNILRLVGPFIEVKTHYLAPNPKTKDRGLCNAEAFKGDERLPQVINCPDWDVTKEGWTGKRICPICKLRKIINDTIKSKGDIDVKEKTRLEKLAGSCAPRTSLKWNVLDREDPYITVSSEEGEKKTLGFKIATVGMEAWNDIDGIFSQLGFDITDAEKGVEVNVIKGNNGARTAYSARAVMDGVTVKQSPLTAEEKELEQHDLLKICGRQTDPEKVLEAIHSDLFELLEKAGEANCESKTTGDDEAVFEDNKKAEAPKNKTASKPAPAPAPAPKAEVKKEEPKEEEAAEGDDGEEEDVNPEEWECFGKIDIKHPECKTCEAKDKCSEASTAKK